MITEWALVSRLSKMATVANSMGLALKESTTLPLTLALFCAKEAIAIRNKKMKNSKKAAFYSCRLRRMFNAAGLKIHKMF
jgi:hypothetical protein